MEKVSPIKSKRKIKQMLEHLEDSNPRDALLFRLGVNTLLRISDLLPLRYKDVFDEDGNFRSHWQLHERKTGKLKRIKLDKKTRKHMRQYAERFGLEDNDYFFFNMREPERHITRQQAFRRLKAAGVKVGLKNFALHSMRKTLPYHIYQDTKDVARIMKMLNHSSERQTLDYLGIEQEDNDKMLEEYAI